MNDVLVAIGDAIRKCGIEFFAPREIEVISELLHVLESIIQLSVGDNTWNEVLLDPIADIFVLAADAPSNELSQQVTGKLVPFLHTMLGHRLAPIKTFAITIFGELLSRRSTRNLLSAEFKATRVNMILAMIVDGPAILAADAADFVSTLSMHEDGRPISEEHDVDILKIAMDRLVGIVRMTSWEIRMKESLVHLVTSLGEYVMGERFPFAEVFPDLLRALPIRKNWGLADGVYRFVNSVYRFISEDVQREYIRVYAWVFARPESQINLLGLSSIVILTSIISLENALSREENAEAVIAEVLEGDEYKMQCFAAVYGKLLPMAKHAFEPELT
jgi:hypothetical protein